MVKIAVLGCGLLGTKIAGCMAYHGHRVKIYDVSPRALSVVQENLDQDKDELYRDGLMTHPTFPGQVLCMSRLEDTVEDAEFIFEAVIEDLEIKKDLFERLTQMCKPDAIIGSNSLQCNIDEIAERANYKERIMNLRFLHPVYTIPEVEITTTRYTTPDNVEKVRQLLEKMGKTLFYRSGKAPLILSDIQIASRKLARQQQILRQRGLAGFPQNDVPGLGHDDNTTPMQDDECEREYDTSTISGDIGYLTRSSRYSSLSKLSLMTKESNTSSKGSVAVPLKRSFSRSKRSKQESVLERLSSPEEPTDFSISRYQSEGVYDQRGGELTIPSHGLTLSIPPGALPEGTRERISVKILRHISPEFTVRDDEMIVTNTFQCLPPGLHFAPDHAVRLTIAHCANLIDPQKVQVVLYSWNHGNEERKPERTVLTSETCRVTPHQVEILLKHFTNRFVAFVNDLFHINGKLMSLMPYLPRRMPETQSMLLEFRMVNKPHGTSWRDVHDISKDATYQPAKDDDDEMNVKDKDLKVICQLNDSETLEEIVKSGSLNKINKHTVYFKMNFNREADDFLWQMKLIQSRIDKDIKFRTQFLASDDVEGERSEASAASLPRDGVDDLKLDKLSKHIPHGSYYPFCGMIGFGYDQAGSILETKKDDYYQAVRKCLGGWKNRTGGSLKELKRILEEAELKALIVHIE